MSSRPPTWRQLLDAATAKTANPSSSQTQQQPLFCDSQPPAPCASQQALASRAPARRTEAPRKPSSTPAFSLTQPQDTGRARANDAGPASLAHSVGQFFTQQPAARDEVPASAFPQASPAADYSQLREEDSLPPCFPETQCTPGDLLLETQATQAVPPTCDLASASADRDGPAVLPISLEHYGTLYSELVGNDGCGRVKVLGSGLEENKYSKGDLKQVLALHGLGVGSRSRKDILAMMVGMTLFCPFQSTPLPPLHNNSTGLSAAECESHLAALGWTEDGPITSVHHIKPHPSASTQAQQPLKQGGDNHGPTGNPVASLCPAQLPIPATGAPASFSWAAPQAPPGASASAGAQPSEAPASVSSVPAQARAAPGPTGTMSGLATLGIAHPAAARQEVPRQQPFPGRSSAQPPTSVPSQPPGSWMGPPPSFYGHPSYGSHGFPFPYQGPYNYPHAPVPFPPWAHPGSVPPAHGETPSFAPDSRKADTTAPAKGRSPAAVPAPPKPVWKKQIAQKLQADLARHKAVLEPETTRVTRQDCVLVALLEDVVTPSSTGKGQESVRKGIHVAAVGRSLKVAHDPELCISGCQDEHVFHMVRIAIGRQPSVSAKKAASGKKALQDDCLELKVDLHRRNQLLTWEDWEAKIAEGSPELEDCWMMVEPLLEAAATAKQAATGFKRKIQGLAVDFQKAQKQDASFKAMDVVWCLEGSVMWPAQVLKDTSTAAAGEVDVELFGSPRVQKEVKPACLRPFDSVEVNPKKHSSRFRAAFEQARLLLEGPAIAEGGKGKEGM